MKNIIFEEKSYNHDKYCEILNKKNDNTIVRVMIKNHDSDGYSYIDGVIDNTSLEIFNNVKENFGYKYNLKVYHQDDFSIYSFGSVKNSFEKNVEILKTVISIQ